MELIMQAIIVFFFFFCQRKRNFIKLSNRFAVHNIIRMSINSHPITTSRRTQAIIVTFTKAEGKIYTSKQSCLPTRKTPNKSPCTCSVLNIRSKYIKLKHHRSFLEGILKHLHMHQVHLMHPHQRLEWVSRYNLLYVYSTWYKTQCIL